MNKEFVGALMASFFMGARITELINDLPRPDDEKNAKLYKYLAQIASGDETIIDSGAEVAATGIAAESLEAIHRDNRKTQRIVANALVRQFGGPDLLH